MQLAHNAIAESKSQKPNVAGIPVVLQSGPSAFVGQKSGITANCYNQISSSVNPGLITENEINLKEVGREALPFSFLSESGWLA
jgi:hypothetical protein